MIQKHGRFAPKFSVSKVRTIPGIPVLGGQGNMLRPGTLDSELPLSRPCHLASALEVLLSQAP